MRCPLSFLVVAISVRCCLGDPRPAGDTGRRRSISPRRGNEPGSVEELDSWLNWIVVGVSPPYTPPPPPPSSPSLLLPLPRFSAGGSSCSMTQRPRQSCRLSDADRAQISRGNFDGSSHVFSLPVSERNDVRTDVRVTSTVTPGLAVALLVALPTGSRRVSKQPRHRRTWC